MMTSTHETLMEKWARSADYLESLRLLITEILLVDFNSWICLVIIYSSVDLRFSVVVEIEESVSSSTR